MFASVPVVARTLISPTPSSYVPSRKLALAERAPVTRQAITKHLRILEDAGLLTQEKRGREVVYALEPEKLEQARAFLDAVSVGATYDANLGPLAFTACVDLVALVNEAACWSQSDASLDLLAPGSSIFSTVPPSTTGSKSGTSMAASLCRPSSTRAASTPPNG